MSRIQKLILALEQCLWPRRCILCKQLSHKDMDLCHNCEQELPSILPCCRQCANTLPTSASHALCGECIKNPPPFELTIALYHYHYPVKQILAALKFNGQLNYAKLLGQLLLKRIKKDYQQQKLPDCIIPMPIHPHRLRQRGFNQAIEIAKPIAKSLKIPMMLSCCHRIRDTPAQRLTPAHLRKNNVKNAFSVKISNIHHVAVVDDVITTSATVTELCHQLHASGVEKIDLWCCARTSRLGRVDS